MIHQKLRTENDKDPPTVLPSIHYYVLSLSPRTSRFYEGFRDALIEMHDPKFSNNSTMDVVEQTSGEEQVRDFFHQVNQQFAQYYTQDPLRLVVAGQQSHLDMFEDMTTSKPLLINRINGNYLKTDSVDLGKIVWPVVRESIAGVNKSAKRDLAAAVKEKTVVSGIGDVSRAVESNPGATLFVEEDYHIKGSLHNTDHTVIISKHVDFRAVLDDVVDILIEQVLALRGSVIFLSNGTLTNFNRIALIPQN